MARSSASRAASRRFLTPQEAHRSLPLRAWGADEPFAEGTWLAIRVRLEQEGWNATQIELMHGQLRQGWPLAMARSNVSLMTGHCPLRGRHEG